jgi:hypothetical protein
MLLVSASPSGALTSHSSIVRVDFGCGFGCGCGERMLKAGVFERLTAIEDRAFNLQLGVTVISVGSNLTITSATSLLSISEPLISTGPTSRDLTRRRGYLIALSTKLVLLNVTSLDRSAPRLGAHQDPMHHPNHHIPRSGRCRIACQWGVSRK